MAPEAPTGVDSNEGMCATNQGGDVGSVARSKRAYVTFLAGKGDYVKGVVGLAKGLRKVKSYYPLVVAVLPDVPEEHRDILKSQGCVVREIEPVYPPENQIQFAMAYYVINYSKLRIWSDFLNMFFQSIYKPIPNVYNLVLAMLWRHPKNVELDKIKVVHYCANGSKPWRYTGKEPNMDREDIKLLVKKWWDIYNDESLDLKPEDSILEGESLSRSSIMASLPGPQALYIPAPSCSQSSYMHSGS